MYDTSQKSSDPCGSLELPAGCRMMRWLPLQPRPPAADRGSGDQDPAPAEAVGQRPATSAGPLGIEIPVERVGPNPHQPRRDFEPGALSQLAESLKVSGVIQPIIVRRVGEEFQ